MKKTTNCLHQGVRVPNETYLSKFGFKKKKATHPSLTLVLSKVIGNSWTLFLNNHLAQEGTKALPPTSHSLHPSHRYNASTAPSHHLCLRRRWQWRPLLQQNSQHPPLWNLRKGLTALAHIRDLIPFQKDLVPYTLDNFISPLDAFNDRESNSRHMEPDKHAVCHILYAVWRYFPEQMI
jgi:hypothetical protein